MSTFSLSTYIFRRGSALRPDIGGIDAPVKEKSFWESVSSTLTDTQRIRWEYDMRKSQWIGVAFTALAFIGGAIANQALVDIGTNLLSSVLQNVATSIQTSLWPWSFSLFFLLTTIVFIWISLVLNRARMTANNILELDDSMTRLFASWLPKGDHTKQMKDLLEELLRDACREFGRYVQRASIMLPDKSNGEYLTIWVSDGMPKEAVERMKERKARLSNRQFCGNIYFNRSIATPP